MELLDAVILKLGSDDAKERNLSLTRLGKTLTKLGQMIKIHKTLPGSKNLKWGIDANQENNADLKELEINIDSIRALHFKYLGRVEKLIKKYEKGSNLDNTFSVEKLKASKLKSFYILWYMLYDTFGYEEAFMDKYDNLIENTDWLFRYEDEVDEYEYYDEEVCSGCGEVHGIVDIGGGDDSSQEDETSKREDGAIPSPFSDEVMSRFRKNKRSMRDVSTLESGKSDAAFEQMLAEMRDSLLDIGEIIFEDENVVHRLVGDLYKAPAEKVGDIVGNYFDKLKKQYQNKDYYQYLARYCNYFPAKSLSGLSPIEALYSINKK